MTNPEPTAPAPAPSKRRLRRLRYFGLAAILALIGVVLLYRSSATLLTIDSGPCTAGAIIVLGGDTYGRPARAAELFKENAAPRIVLSGDGDFDEMLAALKQNGIPESAIWPEDKSGSTKQNAEFSIALLRQRGVTNAIVVTSWYHSRRALNTFRKAAPEMQFYSRPSCWGQDRSLWSQHGLGAHIRAEYIKLLGYWVVYGVSPFCAGPKK